MEPTLWILLAGVIACAAWLAWQDPRQLGQALTASRRLFGNVWIELALGFLLAGALEVLLTQVNWVQRLQHASPGRAVLVGWGVGLLLPGGPYLFFPLAATLLQKGAGPGLVIALISAKTLVSPVRMMVYEAPLMGWPLTLARFAPAVLLPPLLGLLGQWLYGMFSTIERGD